MMVFLLALASIAALSLSAFFSGTETGFLSVSRERILHLAREGVVLEIIAKEVVKKHCRDYLPKNKREMERVVIKGLRKLITDFEIELNLDNYYEELKDYYQDKIGD